MPLWLSPDLGRDPTASSNRPYGPHVGLLSEVRGTMMTEALLSGAFAFAYRLCARGAVHLTAADVRPPANPEPLSTLQG